MSALRELLAKFTVDFDSKPLAKADTEIGGMLKKLEKVGAAIAGAFIVTKIWEFTDGIIQSGEELKTTAERLGLSTQALQEWRFAAGQVNVDTGELTAGFRVLQKNLFEAASVGGDAAQVFARLKVPVKDAHGQAKTLAVILPELADKFAELKNPVEKTALAQKIFGRGGLALIPLLNRGAEGVKEMHEKFEELGGGLSEGTVKSAEEAAIALKDLEFAATGLKSRLAVTLLPFVTDMIEHVIGWAVALQKTTEKTNVFTAALVVVGAVGAVALSPLLGELIGIIAPFAAVILIVDDLITLFHGGKSEIGLFIDKMFGVGASKTFVEELKVAWDELGASIKFVVDQFEHAKQFGEGVSRMFDDAAAFVDRSIGYVDPKTGYNGHREHEGAGDGYGETVVEQSERKGGFLGAVTGYNRAGIAGQSQAIPPADLTSNTGMSGGATASVSSSAPVSISNEVNISVPTSINAKAPEVADLVSKKVTEALESQNRKAMRGGG